MMAASVVRTGMAGTSLETSPAIPLSKHSSSMHEPSVSTPSSSPSNASLSSPEVLNSDEEQDEAKLGRNDHIPSVSSAGKKLAVSCAKGPAASLASSNSSAIHEDETDIALSQLKELDLAIEVRKVTRVDGRKTRWIEYRRERQADAQANNLAKEKPKRKKKPSFKVKKPITNLKKLLSKVNDKDNDLKQDEDADASIVDDELMKESKENTPVIINNNNIIDNSTLKNNMVENSMKAEVGDQVVNSSGANNVLESMKQQFLQGTIVVPKHVSNGVKEKSKKNSKRKKGVTSPNHINKPISDVVKRRRGRPRKIYAAESTDNANLTQHSEPPSPQPSTLKAVSSSLGASTESLNSSANKKVDISNLSQSTTDFYSRRNFLTKGLREVRKSESGSESGGSSPVKDGSGSPSNVIHSPQLIHSPISPLAPTVSESGTTVSSLKGPLISSASKALAAGTKKPKSMYGLSAKKKRILKKISKKENINLIHNSNGHDTIANGSSNKSSEQEILKDKTISILEGQKRGKRGRKAKSLKFGGEPLTWAKTTSTVIVDVHNTMNGEPQTVIPVQNPIVLRKKKVSPPKSLKLPISDPQNELETSKAIQKLDSPKLNSNKQREFVTLVPEISNTSPLVSRSSSPSFNSRKLSNSQSASKVSLTSESGKYNSTKKDILTVDVLESENVPEDGNNKFAVDSDTQKHTADGINESEEVGFVRNGISNTISSSKSNSFEHLDEIKAVSYSNEECKSSDISNKKEDKNVKENESSKEEMNGSITEASSKDELSSSKVNVNNKNSDISWGKEERHSGARSSPGIEEGVKKLNTEKRQRSIQDYMRQDVSKDAKTSNSPISVSNKETDDSDSLFKAKYLSHSPSAGQIAPSPQNTSVSIVVSSEPKITPVKGPQPTISKGILGTKSPKKTPDKVKGKSIHAVLEKLYSPSKKAFISDKTKAAPVVQNVTSITDQNSTHNTDVLKKVSTYTLNSVADDNTASKTLNNNEKKESNLLNRPINQENQLNRPSNKENPLNRPSNKENPLNQLSSKENTQNRLSNKDDPLNRLSGLDHSQKVNSQDKSLHRPASQDNMQKLGNRENPQNRLSSRENSQSSLNRPANPQNKLSSQDTHKDKDNPHNGLSTEGNPQNKIISQGNPQNKLGAQEPALIERKKLSKSANTNPNPDKLIGPVGKSKEKIPRFLKQLFQDEGVQNMLRSVNEEASASLDGVSSSDTGLHKLRPKRTNENMISDSPEPDDSLFAQGSKRKKRGTEVDNLFLDEGTLNLLTSLETGSRRISALDDASNDSAQDSGLKTNVGIKQKIQSDAYLDAPRKRKLSGSSNSSTGVPGKVMQSQERETKKQRLDTTTTNMMHSSATPNTIEIEKPVAGALVTGNEDRMKKKPGRPSLPVPLKQKTKAHVMLQLRRQLKMLGKPSENLSIQQMRELIAKAKGLNTYKTVNSKPIPPLKIKLPVDQDKVAGKAYSFAEQPIVKVSDRPTSRVENNQSRTSISNTLASNQTPSIRVPKSTPGFNTSSTSSPITNTSPGALHAAYISGHTPEGVRNTLLPYGRPKTLSGQGNRPTLKYPPNVAPRKGVPVVPGSSQPPQITSLVRSLEPTSASLRSRARGPGEGLRQSQRSSVRQSEGNYHFRDISLRKFNNFMQIILTPSTTKMKNALNSRVLRELCEALSTLRRDESVRMVLLTATGSTFCQGIDLTSLQHPNQDTRKKNAENLARSIKDFLRALVQFPKMIVAGVNGSAMGLGVTMLPLFDMVYATDKAEFFLPYAKLGQVPEGGATYTFPNYYGKLQSNKLFLGQKITAVQAQQMGLVSESIWPATFQQELLPKVALLASQSSQSMECTKALMNHHIITKLELSVESECRILLQQWTSQNFLHLSKRFLDASDVQLQKPVNLPL